MKTQVIDFNRPDLSPKKLFLTLGGFDGIHLGHQSLIKKLVERAKAKRASSALCLFDPLPFQVLNNQDSFKRLFTISELESILQPFGLDFFLIVPFTKEFSRWSPSDFIRSFLIHHFNPLFVLLGYDFSYAYKKKGSFATFKDYENFFAVEQAPALLYKKQPISSSRIRENLFKGNMPELKALLGRAFSIESKVIKGNGRGKKIGFPTANLQLQKKEYPPFGVYAGQAVLRGKSYRAVINIGVRPTFFKNSEIFC